MFVPQLHHSDKRVVQTRPCSVIFRRGLEEEGLDPTAILRLVVTTSGVSVKQIRLVTVRRELRRVVVAVVVVAQMISGHVIGTGIKK